MPLSLLQQNADHISALFNIKMKAEYPGIIGCFAYGLCIHVHVCMQWRMKDIFNGGVLGCDTAPALKRVAEGGGGGGGGGGHTHFFPLPQNLFSKFPYTG